MLYDICLGILVYIGVSLSFGEPFQASHFFLALFFSFLPDIDFVPYLLFRKKLNLVTHWFLHFPLLFGTLGAIVYFFSPYIGMLFLVCTLGHLIHDLFSETIESFPQGIQLLYPFSKTSLSWQNGQFKILDESERKAQLALRRSAWKTVEKRNIWWEIGIRMETMSILAWILLGVSGGALTWFIVK